MENSYGLPALWFDKHQHPRPLHVTEALESLQQNAEYHLYFTMLAVGPVLYLFMYLYLWISVKGTRPSLRNRLFSSHNQANDNELVARCGLGGLIFRLFLHTILYFSIGVAIFDQLLHWIADTQTWKSNLLTHINLPGCPHHWTCGISWFRYLFMSQQFGIYGFRRVILTALVYGLSRYFLDKLSICLEPGAFPSQRHACPRYTTVLLTGLDRAFFSLSTARKLALCKKIFGMDFITATPIRDWTKLRALIQERNECVTKLQEAYDFFIDIYSTRAELIKFPEVPDQEPPRYQEFSPAIRVDFLRQNIKDCIDRHDQSRMLKDEYKENVTWVQMSPPGGLYRPKFEGELSLRLKSGKIVQYHGTIDSIIYYRQRVAYLNQRIFRTQVVIHNGAWAPSLESEFPFTSSIFVHLSTVAAAKAQRDLPKGWRTQWLLPEEVNWEEVTTPFPTISATRIGRFFQVLVSILSAIPMVPTVSTFMQSIFDWLRPSHQRWMAQPWLLSSIMFIYPLLFKHTGSWFMYVQATHRMLTYIREIANDEILLKLSPIGFTRAVFIKKLDFLSVAVLGFPLVLGHYRSIHGERIFLFIMKHVTTFVIVYISCLWDFTRLLAIKGYMLGALRKVDIPEENASKSEPALALITPILLLFAQVAVPLPPWYQITIIVSLIKIMGDRLLDIAWHDEIDVFSILGWLPESLIHLFFAVVHFRTVLDASNLMPRRPGLFWTWLFVSTFGTLNLVAHCHITFLCRRLAGKKPLAGSSTGLPASRKEMRTAVAEDWTPWVVRAAEPKVSLARDKYGLAEEEVRNANRWYAPWISFQSKEEVVED